MAILAVVLYYAGYPSLCWIIAAISSLREFHRAYSWYQEHKRGYYILAGRKRHINLERWE